jgi:predicted DNA binding CopG/RHH family protein
VSIGEIEILLERECRGALHASKGVPYQRFVRQALERAVMERKR